MSHSSEPLHLSFKPSLCSTLLTPRFLSLCVLQPQSLQASIEAGTVYAGLKGVIHTKMKIVIICSPWCHSKPVWLFIFCEHKIMLTLIDRRKAHNMYKISKQNHYKFRCLCGALNLEKNNLANFNVHTYGTSNMVNWRFKHKGLLESQEVWYCATQACAYHIWFALFLCTV